MDGAVRPSRRVVLVRFGSGWIGLCFWGGGFGLVFLLIGDSRLLVCSEPFVTSAGNVIVSCLADCDDSGDATTGKRRQEKKGRALEMGKWCSKIKMRMKSVTATFVWMKWWTISWR